MGPVDSRGMDVADAYELDPEKLPQAIADLEEAYLAAQSLRNRVSRLMEIRPGNGSDEVSINAAVQLNRIAIDESIGSLAKTQRELVDAIGETRDKFKRMLADYLHLEDVNQLPDYDLPAAELPQVVDYWERQAERNGQRSPGGATAI
ncbi:hypothetical protein FHR81_004989 [Actinoalloteichus hoggarensis]|uniref:hypothetical protein n=1 Tax=Actinoalloteichus hoggarensis TaxID=1470176 RepID=UPI0012FD3BF7|nr:hypothetical protein [Actinoalloteichus hoggarensis]MBB5923916.1 hypothetical protein [Actinoalloteichus hoggarensis]